MAGTAPILGYCTNVHPQRDWQQTVNNLHNHTALVRELVCPKSVLPVGLWLASDVLTGLLQRGCNELKDICASLGLLPFTFNGFPFGNFHQPIVKHAVYEPAWDQPQRLRYTLALAKLHAAMADGPCERSISTVPLGWGDLTRTPVDLETAINHLCSLAEALATLHNDTGVLVHVDIEPEPGCIVERSIDVVHLFEQLCRAGNEDTIRQYLRVCHDVCHAAVMFEEQAAVLQCYRSAGIRVGKVQLSSALHMHLNHTADDAQCLAELRDFAEDRYLHQTIISSGAAQRFYEDLPQAMADTTAASQDSQWRVHYHVPIFLNAIRRLHTTQQAICECLDALDDADDVQHFEVETYTWNVLPESMREQSLAQGIARELQWVMQQSNRFSEGIAGGSSGGESGGKSQP